MKTTRVSKSTVAGKGLFACQDFAAGEKVEEMTGEIFYGESKSKFACRLPKGKTLILTGKIRMVNAAYGCTPNVRITLKGLIATADIKAGEELFSRYDSCF